MSEEILSNNTESAAPVTESSSTTESTVQADTGTELNTSSILASDDVPDYTPDYKFKVMDEEKEVDEWLRPLIKDKETEKKAKEILEKAYGLDYAKPKHEERETQLKEVSQNYSQVVSDVREVLGARDNKDFDTMLSLLNIPVENMAQWLVDKANRLNLPEEHQKVYNEYDDTRRTNYSLERRLRAMEQREQQQSVQARTSELGSVLSRPEVTSAIKSFDSRPGFKSGSFRDAVIRHAKAEWYISKRDLTAEQAVQEVMGLVGASAQQSGQTSMSVSADTSQLPVIPRISGKSVSATSKQPRSVDDLKKLARGATL